VSKKANHPSPDQLCSDASKDGVKICIQKMNNEEEYVLIEAKEEALKFLGQLLLAQAGFEKDCGFSISPDGAGSDLFTKNSNLGIYIHRLPCLDEEE
jgi:hypothetical protein